MGATDLWSAMHPLPQLRRLRDCGASSSIFLGTRLSVISAIGFI